MRKLFASLFALTLLAPGQSTTEPTTEPTTEAPAPTGSETTPAEDIPAPSESATKKPAKPQFAIDLGNLSTEKSKKYFEAYFRADTLFKQKRIFECLDEIHALHEIYDKNPASLNLEGACYVEFRSFEKARLAFAKALKANSGSFNVRFNLAEIEFVTENWEEALKQLGELAKEAKVNNQLGSMIPLIQFKMLLCLLKIDDLDGAKVILAETDFLDDSPLFYYGNAAMEYFSDRGAKAEVWLARAGRIFRNPSAIAPWKDTLIEFGYIKSFYGGDLEVEVNSPTGGGE